jgi:hypothetical protein
MADLINMRTQKEPIRYDGISKSFRTGRLERELQMAQLSGTRCSCIAILWVSIVSFVAITLCVASQRVVPKISVYFVIDSVRKRLDTTTYNYALRQSSRCCTQGWNARTVLWLAVLYTLYCVLCGEEWLFSMKWITAVAIPWLHRRVLMLEVSLTTHTYSPKCNRHCVVLRK